MLSSVPVPTMRLKGYVRQSWQVWYGEFHRSQFARGKVHPRGPGRRHLAQLIFTVDLDPYGAVLNLSWDATGPSLPLFDYFVLLDDLTLVPRRIGVVNDLPIGLIHGPEEPVVTHPVIHDTTGDLEPQDAR